MPPSDMSPEPASRRAALAMLGRLGLAVGAGVPILGCKKRDRSQPQPDPAAPLLPEKQGVFGKEAPARPKVVVFLDSLETPMRNFQQVLTERLVRARAGVDLVQILALGDVQRQIAQLRTQVAQGGTHLFVFPVDAQALVPVLTELKAAGVTIIAFSKDLPEKACTTALYVDEAKIGDLAGSFVVSALQQKSADEGRPETVGRVVQITGPEGSAYSNAVSTAFQAALKKAPGVVLVHDAPANWAAEEAGYRFNDALRLQKQFDVVFCHSDFMAFGAARAARAAQPPVRDSLLILGLDGNPGNGGGLSLVVNSEIDATVHVPPLVDFAWDICVKILDDPAYTPKPRYELLPVLASGDLAATLQSKGSPKPGL